jgi:hypothetical protein
LGRLLRGAAIELAERTEEVLRSDRKAHERDPGFQKVTGFLKDRWTDAKELADVRRRWDDNVAKHKKAAEADIAETQCKVRIQTLHCSLLRFLMAPILMSISPTSSVSSRKSRSYSETPRLSSWFAWIDFMITEVRLR